MSQHANPPTRKQLAYLRTLAQRAGQTFLNPATSREASAEIRRLRKQTPSTRTERATERKAITADLQERPGDATRVRDGEITGYGASATWR